MSVAFDSPLQAPQLPRRANWYLGVGAVALGGLAWLMRDSLLLAVVVAMAAFLVALPLWTLIVENGRAAVDRLVTGLVWTAFGVALVPLIWLIWLVVSKGFSQLDGTFLSYSMRSVVGDMPGGLYHALMGTLIVTGLAMLIAIPVGIFAAIYLVEYGKGTRMARVITFLVDVMTGIPSIVAGLFAFALFALIFGPSRFGFAGSVALTLLMIPTVVRSTEEMLKLVPNDLREASYALGVPKWRTIVKVVLPTSIAGIITGVVLAISRVIGETAPLLVAAGATNNVNMNPFSDDPMMTIPVFIYTQYGMAEPKNVGYAWGGAAVLVIIVVILNIIARVIGKIFAPKTGR